MFRFSGFKVSLNFSSGKRISNDYAENIPSFSSTNGAYRLNREEFYETSTSGSYADPSTKITPSMVKLPPNSQTSAVKPSKSTGDLTQFGVPNPPPLPPPNSVARPTKSTSDLTQNKDGKALSTQRDTNAQVPRVTSKLTKTKVATAVPNEQTKVKNTKSTSDLDQISNIPPQLRKSTPNVSSDPKGGPSNYRDSADLRKSNSKDAKKQEKERKMIEKKRLAEQKKNDKLAADEQAKQEKLRKDKEKREAKNEKLAAEEQAKQEKLRKEKENQEAKLAKLKAKKDKGKKTPVPKPRTNPLAQGSGSLPTTNTTQKQAPSATQVPAQSQSSAQRQGPTQYTTNTLESSISKTSGPPAYTETPAPKANLVQNENDASGNTSFTKKVDNSDYSWDLIDQHRQQISRPPVTGGGRPKQKVMDLQYHTGRSAGDNTEA